MDYGTKSREQRLRMATTKTTKITLWDTIAKKYGEKESTDRVRKPGDWDYCPLCSKLAARSGIRNHYRVKHPEHFVAVEIHILSLREKQKNGRN